MNGGHLLTTGDMSSLRFSNFSTIAQQARSCMKLRRINLVEHSMNCASNPKEHDKIEQMISELGEMIASHQFEVAAKSYLDIESARTARAIVSKLSSREDKDLLIVFFREVLRSAPSEDRAALIALQLSRFYLALNMAGSSLRVIWPFRRLSKRSQARLASGDRRNIKFQIAQSLTRNNRLPEAEHFLRDILLFDPSDTEVLLSLASISRQKPEEYTKLVRRALEVCNGSSFRALSLYLDRLLDLGQVEEFEIIIGRYFKLHKERPEVFLLLANRELMSGSMSGYRSVVDRYFDSFGLKRPPFRRDGATGFPDLGRLRPKKMDDGPVVSVIMTSHNSSEYMSYAISSVLDQTYKNLELHVVDDCSTDNSCDIVMQFAREDARVRLHRTSSNVGTYVAKNSAIDECLGTYITFHDSDDWMHPERLSRYVAKMQGDPTIACVTSEWVRLDWRGRAILRRAGGFSHLNPASTMYAAEALERYGRFDEVRAGADSELMWRIRRNAGPNSVSRLKEPLGFGLHREDSLTMNSVTGFDENRYSRVRLLYWEAWSAWHLKTIVKRKSIRLPRGQRRFAAPDAILVDPRGS